MSSTIRFIAASVLVVLVVASAQSQDRPKPKRDKMPPEGKLIGVARGMIKVQTEDGGQWLVALGRDTEAISVVGSADPSWLRPGMLVRFSGHFNRKGEAVAPIKEVSVVTMREGMRFGITPANAPSRFGGTGGGLFADEEEEKARAAKPTRPKKAKPEDIKYVVVGKIAKIRKGEYSIAAGRLIKFELDEKPRIDIDVADLSLVPQGASIKLDAWYYPNQPGRAMASKITVALEKTLAGETITRRGAFKPAAADAKKEQPQDDTKEDSKDDAKKESKDEPKEKADDEKKQ